MSKLLSGIGGTLLKAGAVVGIAGFVGTQCIYNVPAGSRGLIFDRIQGIKETVDPEGTHFIIPILHHPKLMDVRTTPRVISTVTGTKDMQKVNISLRILSRPDIKDLPKLFRELGPDYGERILPSLGNEVLKAVVAQYNADQLLTLRDQVSREIREQLSERTGNFNIILDDVAITHLNFSRDFSRAIEDKQVAEQMAERAKFVVAKSEQQAKADIIRAEGDAEAAQLVSNAIKVSGRGLIEVRRIETALEVAETLGRGRGNVTYLPSQGNLLLNLSK